MSVPVAARGSPSSDSVATVTFTSAGAPSAPEAFQASAETLARSGAKPALTTRSATRVSPEGSVTSATTR